MEQFKQIIRKIVTLPILFYQMFIRSLLPPSCRFYPSCSDYALKAIAQLGVLHGLRKACWRLLRCHPWAKGGYDPVISTTGLTKINSINNEKL